MGSWLCVRQLFAWIYFVFTYQYFFPQMKSRLVSHCQFIWLLKLSSTTTVKLLRQQAVSDVVCVQCSVDRRAVFFSRFSRFATREAWGLRLEAWQEVNLISHTTKFGLKIWGKFKRTGGNRMSNKCALKNTLQTFKIQILRFLVSECSHDSHYFRLNCSLLHTTPEALAISN